MASPAAPIFDPGLASGSAAAFAGILAAIVLAVIGQLATTDRTTAAGGGTRGHKYQFSLIVGFPLLVQLLACAYMFVLLSGRMTDVPDSKYSCDVLPDATTRAACHTDQLAAVAQATSSVRGAAFDFAICGSVLAVAAAAALVFLRLVVQETGGASSVAARMVTILIVTGVFIDVLFLVYGYGDIHQAFYNRPFPFGLWISNAALLAVFPLVAAVLKTRRIFPPKLRLTEITPPTTRPPGPFWRRLPLLPTLVVASVVLGTILPTWAFLIANKHVFNGAQPFAGPSVVWVSYVSGAWAGLLFGLLVWLGRTTD